MAVALEQAFRERGHEVVSFDALPKFLIPTYGIISRYFLSFWGFLFWTSNKERASKIVAQLGNRLVANKIAEQIKREVPDFIISDHPFITKVKEEIFKTKLPVPLGVVVVDPVSVHAVWFKGKPDVYFIPTKVAGKLALEGGVPEEKIVYTGYPIRKEFYEKPNLKMLRKSLGLEAENFTILIGGSSEGLGKINDLCEKLGELSSRYEFQAIVICGRNKSLFRKLSSKYYYDPRFKILGYERHLPNYVLASDVVVSKAGPTNLYEAIAAEKPFLAFSCMPGQEEGNLELIRKAKIGIVENDIDRVLKILRKWIRVPKDLEQFRKGIEEVKNQQGNSAMNIVKYVEGFKNDKRL